MAFFHDHPTLDPDFDDETGALALLQHEVAAGGTIPIHPDGDRLVDDPVPLHTRVYCADTVAELKIREWARHIKEWKAKVAQEPPPEIMMVMREARLADPMPEPPPIRPPDLPPVDPTQLMIFQMRISDPIQPRQGRVWQDLVMINEADLDYWRKDYHRRSLPEVWRGRGFVIFKLR